MDQNGRPLEIRAKARKHIKGYGFLSFAKNLFNKYGEKILDPVQKQE